MKFVKQFNPKQLFRIKKTTRSVSRSDPPSFGSGSSSSSTSSTALSATPKSILRSKSHEILMTTTEWSGSDFSIIDKDGDGKITRTELETLLSRIGPGPLSEEEINLMLTDVIDHDGGGGGDDGVISLEKFGEISSAFGPACGSELRDAFDIFDADRDGKISAEELLGVFMAIGDEQCTLEDCRRMIDGVDTDGDGFVCFEDFSRMMEHQQQQKQR